MLSAYREREIEEQASVELDAHLEQCAACRETLASYTDVGAKVHAAPVFAPPQDMHAKLMKALADEQLKFLQKSAPGKVSTPEFLKPYLPERARETQRQDDIASFSTAETGPLPIIRTKRKPRRVQVNQLAVLGLAAAILIMLMTGGLTSLLMLAKSNPTSISKTTSSLALPTEVDQKFYTTNTLYPNVTSAIPSGNYVYYAASGNGANSNSWMIMQLDRSTQISKPLLNISSSDPLVVLQASNSWLVWLEYSLPQPMAHENWPGNNSHHSPQRTWSLHYLSLLQQPQSQSTASGNGSATSTPTVTVTPTRQTGAKTPVDQQPVVALLPESTVLTQGIFDSLTAPTWVTTPVQGTWLANNTLLVVALDAKGISHLESYQLVQPVLSAATGKAAVSQTAVTKEAKGQLIATAPAGHVFTWPTADTSGMDVYWADEWIAADGTLQSDVWQQTAFEQIINNGGYPEAEVSYTQKIFLADGLSFQPQVVDNTLFFLSASEISVTNNDVVPNGIPLPLSATDSSVNLTPRTDPSVYASLPDATVHGTIFMIPLNGLNLGTENSLGTVGQAVGLQAGNNYVVWQDSSGYKMYDVVRQADVVLGDTLNNATILIVDGNTTLWFSGDTMPGANLTLMVYNWPN
jgi:hypothetical protein